MKGFAMDREIDLEKLNWLTTSSQIADMEKSTDAPEIWVITSDMKDDAPGGPFQEIVTANLKRGIKYRFFIPDRDEIREGATALIAHNGHSDNLKITYLGEDYFFLVPIFDFAIYNPFKEGESDRMAFLGVHTPDGEMYYCAKVGDRLVESMVRQLRVIL